MVLMSATPKELSLKRTLLICLILILLLLAAVADEEVSLFSPEGDAAVQLQQTAMPAVAVATEEPITVELAETVAEEMALITQPEIGARDELIDSMIDLAQSLYQKTKGRAQPAYNSGHIYICKNFTVHLFRENRDDYRMAAYPDVPLLIPNNLPAKESKPYSYGIAWEDVPADKGNPFVAAHSFYYNNNESPEQNRERALSFMREVERGDFFQMSADYYYGIGAHSLVFTQDYDEAAGTVTWTDSNMKGESRGGQRYGVVQFDADKPIEWFVDAFCMKGRGATLYRLRDDIIKR